MTGGCHPGLLTGSTRYKATEQISMKHIHRVADAPAYKNSSRVFFKQWENNVPQATTPIPTCALGQEWGHIDISVYCVIQHLFQLPGAPVFNLEIICTVVSSVTQ